MSSAELPGDGGPAFAATATSASDDVYHQEGMSLRDYFAAAALTAMGTWTPDPRIEDGDDPSRYDPESQHIRRARYAYAQADEMLKVRAPARCEGAHQEPK